MSETDTFDFKFETRLGPCVKLRLGTISRPRRQEGDLEGYLNAAFRYQGYLAFQLFGNMGFFEDSKVQYNEHILVTRLPKNILKAQLHAITSVSTSGLLCLIITFAPLPTPNKIPHSLQSANLLNDSHILSKIALQSIVNKSLSSSKCIGMSRAVYCCYVGRCDQ